MQLIKRKHLPMSCKELSAIGFVLILTVVAQVSFAQDTASTVVGHDCENIKRQVTEGEIDNMEPTESRRTVNNAIVCHLQKISEIAPEIPNSGGYTFTNDNHLDQTVELFTEIRRGLQVGGYLYNVIQLQIAKTKDLMREISADPQMSESFKTDMIGAFQAENEQFLALRTKLTALNDQLRQFTNIEAPAIQREARYVQEYNITREVRRELSGFANALEAALGAVDDNPLETGTD